ncbi:MAG: hypothetical protein F2667_12590 [Actinobacteria bacterium]|uniref:Unannotated protein n=1 Tax=freshwater metagenome TaxID=449393 RepID=A0A6J6RZH1_9ZZZZ|nr:hypothetical protein [Actinomycetota bacterium]
MSAATYRQRLRTNAAMALTEHATVTDLIADVLAITRHGTRPGIYDHADAHELVDLATALLATRTPETITDTTAPTGPVIT